MNPYMLEDLITIEFGIKLPDFKGACLHVHACLWGGVSVCVCVCVCVCVGYWIATS